MTKEKLLLRLRPGHIDFRRRGCNPVGEQREVLSAKIYTGTAKEIIFFRSIVNERCFCETESSIVVVSIHFYHWNCTLSYEEAIF